MDKEIMEDVLVVENKTGIITAIIGTNLNVRQSERRQMTGLSRIHDDYHINTCPTGTYKTGDVYGLSTTSQSHALDMEHSKANCTASVREPGYMHAHECDLHTDTREQEFPQRECPRSRGLRPVHR